MSAKEKQGFSLYFLIAFGLAWLCQVGGCMALLQQMAHRQACEGCPSNIGRIFRFVHERAGRR